MNTQNNIIDEMYEFASVQQNIRQAKKTIPLTFFSAGSRGYKNNQAFVIPNMASFIRDVTEHGNIGALKKRVLQLSIGQIITLAWWNKANLLKLAKKDFSTGVSILIQIELLQILRFNPSLVVLSDQIVDLSTALNNTAILDNFLSLVKHTLQLRAGIMTNNMLVTMRALRSLRSSPDRIFFPYNIDGYEMNPLQKDVEDYLGLLEDTEKLVAMLPETDTAANAYIRKAGITKVLLKWL